MCEICTKLTIEIVVPVLSLLTLNRFDTFFSVFLVDFEQPITDWEVDFVQMTLLLTLNMYIKYNCVTKHNELPQLVLTF